MKRLRNLAGACGDTGRLCAHQRCSLAALPPCRPYRLQHAKSVGSRAAANSKDQREEEGRWGEEGETTGPQKSEMVCVCVCESNMRKEPRAASTAYVNLGNQRLPFHRFGAMGATQTLICWVRGVIGSAVISQALYTDSLVAKYRLMGRSPGLNFTPLRQNNKWPSSRGRCDPPGQISF